MSSRVPKWQTEIVMDSTWIKKLRENYSMSQEDFAHSIGVTFATVNRWENKRTTPSKVAQQVLYQLYKKLIRMQRVSESLLNATHTNIHTPAPTERKRSAHR